MLQTDSPNQNSSISPNQLWSAIQNNLEQVALRRHILPKKRAGTPTRVTQTNLQPGTPTHSKNKFTGSPAFKEMKNLIVLILTSQASQKP